MMPRAIAFDLDNTLAESKSPVTTDMGALLAALMERIPVAVMSGGAYAQFQKQLLPAIPQSARCEKLYLFPVCAGYCYNVQDGVWTLIDDNSLTADEKARIMQALTEAMEETGFAQPPSQVWGERIEDRGALIAFSALGQEAPIEEKKKWDPDKAKRRPLHAALVRRLPGFEVKMNATTTIDITRQGITKAYGVRTFSRLTTVPIPDMLYVGDALFPGGNDEVVKETGIPTRQVEGPGETLEVIKELLQVY